MRGTIASAILAMAALAGCASTNPTDPEAVVVLPFNVSSLQYRDVREFAAASSVIIVGRFSAGQVIAAEVQPSDGEEGVAAGEGPDLYGVVAFTVTSVLEGDPDLKELRIVYESGKRDGSRRIAYRHEGLSMIQRPDATLRSSAELAGTTFVIFAAPVHGSHPVKDGVYVLSHPNGIAELGDDGLLSFAGGAPVAGGPLTLDDVRAEVK